MPTGLQRALSREVAQDQAVVKQVIKFTALAIEVDGATGVGFGSGVIADVPQGNILVLGAVCYATFTGPGSASVSDTWAGDYGVGSTPADDATIAGTDVDMIQSTAIAAATAEVSPRTRGTNASASTGVVLDNTDGSLEINLSLLVDDADISADTMAFTAGGELHLSYVVLGDD